MLRVCDALRAKSRFTGRFLWVSIVREHLESVNIANRRVLLDNSFTFGGTHFLKPREIFTQFCYLFHY